MVGPDRPTAPATEPVGRLSVVMVDCLDPERLAAFWSAVLAVPVRGRWHQYVSLQPTAPAGPRLVFQRVPELPAGQRLHLDVHVDDLDVAAVAVEALGAARVRDVTVDGERWRVMADPEGHVFCLVLDPQTG